MGRQKIKAFVLLATLVASLIIWHPVTIAQERAKPQLSSEEAKETTEPPGVAKFAPKVAELARRLSLLENEIAAFPDLADTEKSFAKIEKNLDRLGSRLEALRPAEGYDYKQFANLKVDLEGEGDALAEVMKPLTKAIKYLESSQQEWSEEKRQWAEWRISLAQDPAADTVAQTFDKAQEIINLALNLVAPHLRSMLAVQQKAIDTGAQVGSLTAEADASLVAARYVSFQDESPPMFSSRYFSQFDGQLWDEAREGLAKVSWPGKEFFKRAKWMISIQALLSLVIAIGILRSRFHLKKTKEWHFLAKRPFAVGICLGSLAEPYYYSMPPAWELALWTVGGIAAARVVSALVKRAWAVRLFYVLVAFIIFTFLFSFLAMPLPIFRLYVFFAALAGSLICFWQAVRSGRDENLLVYTWILRLSGLILLAVFVVEVFGYSEFAFFLFESSLTTIYFLVMAWILMVMARGLLELAVGSSLLQEIWFVRENTAVVVRRIALLTNLFIIFLLVCYVLATWRVFGSPNLAIHALLTAGFKVGSLRITVGLVVIALACIYGSILASYGLQAVLTQTVFSQKDLERGVRIAISRLIHYSFFVVGFILALVALGLKLTNITIIGGALGVGIGFGLQGIVNNFVSGLILLFERPIKIGDFITIGNQWGEIKEIGLRATVVQTFDRSNIVVPNSDLVSNAVTNWTLYDRFMRLIVPVGVAYGSDMALVTENLMECAETNSKVMRMPEPQILFRRFGESSLEFELRVWISNLGERLVVESELHHEIDRRFRQAGIEIAFPQRDLHIRSGEESPPSILGRPESQPPDLVMVPKEEGNEEDE